MGEGHMHCQFCGKSFIAEELKIHPCWMERNPVKDITIDFSYETVSEDGDKTIHAYDLKGNIYRLTKPNPTKLAELKRVESHESKQEDYSAWLQRRGNSSRNSPIYTPYILTGGPVDECLRQKLS
jgi:hypothetical protein